MKKQTFPLTSISSKVLATVITLFMLGISVFLSVNNALWYWLLFSWILTCLCLAGSLICLLNRIVLDLQKREFFIYSIKIKRLKIDDVSEIEIDTDFSLDCRKYCFIVFVMKDGSVYKISGFSSLLKIKDVDITQNLIDKLNAFLKEN